MAELGAGAVGLNVDTLGVKATADFLGRGTVDLSCNGAAGDRNNAGKFGGVGLGVGHGAKGHNVVATPGTKVVDLADIEGRLNGLASSDGLESLLTESGGHDTELDSIELELVA